MGKRTGPDEAGEVVLLSQTVIPGRSVNLKLPLSLVTAGTNERESVEHWLRWRRGVMPAPGAGGSFLRISPTARSYRGINNSREWGRYERRAANIAAAGRSWSAGRQPTQSPG